jgi:hypothetical protein
VNRLEERHTPVVSYRRYHAAAERGEGANAVSLKMVVEGWIEELEGSRRGHRAEAVTERLTAAHPHTSGHVRAQIEDWLAEATEREKYTSKEVRRMVDLLRHPAAAAAVATAT